MGSGRVSEMWDPSEYREGKIRVSTKKGRIQESTGKGGIRVSIEDGKIRVSTEKGRIRTSTGNGGSGRIPEMLYPSEYREGRNLGEL